MLMLIRGPPPQQLCLLSCCPSPGLVDLFEAVMPILPSLEEAGVAVWVLGPGNYPPGVTSLDSLLDDASDQPVPSELSAPENWNDTCLYIFTSGTTGRVLTHHGG